MKEDHLDYDEKCYKQNRLSNFEKYKKSDDPQVRKRANDWSIAIGLQAVDGLTVSDYLLDLACKNIEGEITMDEVDRLLDQYYEEKRKLKAACNEYATYTRVDVHPDPKGTKRGRPI